MTNINNFDPDLLMINEIPVFSSGSSMYEIIYNEECKTPYFVYNNITCVFRKRGQKKYEETEDNILKELESSQSFLYRHIKDTPYYKHMLPSSNQPARFFTSAKTHKSDNLSDIKMTNLTLRPIIDQTGTCYYKTGKFISKHLKPLTKNEFVINNTQDFPTMLNNVPISEDEEDVSYDVESLFTNIPLKDTIDFICEEIYVNKKLEPICKKSIFKKLLYKLTTECTSSATGKLQKQVDGVSMGGTLSVTLSDCFMNKMERDIILPLKPKFYHRIRR